MVVSKSDPASLRSRRLEPLKAIVAQRIRLPAAAAKEAENHTTIQSLLMQINADAVCLVRTQVQQIIAGLR
jgi:hypothetical protein